jgi:hypothetical protein
LPQKSSLAANWIPQKTAVRFAVLRCSSLFLILIEIAWYFADFHTPSSSLARPQDMGPAGSPVFAENLQALTIPFAITTTPLSILSYCYSSFPRATSIHITNSHVPRRYILLIPTCHVDTYYYKNAQLSIGERLEGEDTSFRWFLPRAWLLRNMPLSCGIIEPSHGYSISDRWNRSSALATQMAGVQSPTQSPKRVRLAFIAGIAYNVSM